MTPFVQFVTTILSIGTVLMQILILKCIAILVVPGFGKQKLSQNLTAFVQKYIFEIGFLIALGSMLGSLFYSVVAHFVPCEFCWWQRLFLFPQAFVFGVALYYKRMKGVFDERIEKIIVLISLLMSICGGAIGLFQYYGATFNPSLLDACVAGGVSCAKNYFTSFGYITIPLMSLTTFVLLVLLVLISKRKTNA